MKIFKRLLIIILAYILLVSIGIFAVKSIKKANAYYKNNEIDSFVLTDLTGTSWEFNNILNTTNINFNIDFTSNGDSYSKLKRLNELILEEDFLQYGMYTVYSNQVWYNDSYRTIEITGGTDATNSSLISWLQSNATQIQTGPTQLTTPIITKIAYNQISWSSISNAEYYEIYENNELYDTSENTLYTVDSLGNFQVLAVGDGQNYSNSELSNTISITATQLNTPTLSINNDLISWSNVQNASSYQIFLDNELIETINTNSYTITENGNYKVKAISNNLFFTDSNFSNTLVVNYQYAKVVFYSIDNITELMTIDNWLIGQSIYNFNNIFYSYNNLLTLIANDSNIDISLINNGSIKIIFNDNQLFNSVSFDKYFIVSSDIDIYYKLEKSFNTASKYDTNNYSVSGSNDSSIFINNGENLLHQISLDSINVTYDWLFCGSRNAQTSSIVTTNMTLFEGFEIGDNFSVYIDSLGNEFYFDCVVSQSSLSTTYINYLYKVNIINESFYFPCMDYNKFIIFDESTNTYQFIQNDSTTRINYISSFETIYKYNQNMNFYYCNYIGFSFNIQNYYNCGNNQLFSYIQDTNFKFYEYFYNYTGLTNNLNNFEYILINSENFNNYKYLKTYLYLDFESVLENEGLTGTFNSKASCINALENKTLLFSFGSPIIYYFDTTNKTDSATGTSFIPLNSSGLYKTDYEWYDVGAYIYNLLVYLIFDAPIISNITQIIYQIVNLILFVFNQIILLFGSVKNNIFIVSILGFLTLKFVINLLVK